MPNFRVILLGAVAVITLKAGPVSATNIFDENTSACTGTNCSSLRIPGTVISSNTASLPWVIEAFANPGQCMRLDVIIEDADLEIVAVAPDGTVFRNDDRNLGDNRPLVKIDPTPGPASGWYTVRVQHWNGVGVDANFAVLYALYNTGNVNCSSPTPPAVAEFGAEGVEALAEELKPESEVTPPKPGTPGAE